MTPPSSPTRVPHGAATILVARSLRDATPTPQTQEAVAHVLGCNSCLADLAQFLGDDIACQVVWPALKLYAHHETGEPSVLVDGLADRIEEHLVRCADCRAEAASQQVQVAFAKSQGPARIAAELALRLLDAALMQKRGAKTLFASWLADTPKTMLDVVDEASAIPFPPLQQAAQALRPLLDQTRESILVGAAWQVLQPHAELLEEELGLSLPDEMLRPVDALSPPRPLPSMPTNVIGFRPRSALAASGEQALHLEGPPPGLRAELRWRGRPGQSWLELALVVTDWLAVGLDPSQPVRFVLRRQTAPAGVPWADWALSGPPATAGVMQPGAFAFRLPITKPGPSLSPEQVDVIQDWIERAVTLDPPTSIS